MTHSPLISVVVVGYSRPGDLRDCLVSLQAQTLTDFEVVVVLNGATDAVSSAARRVAAEDPRVVLVAQSETPAGEARNAGAKAARGAILYFVDDDVCVPPEGLESLHREMSALPDVSILGGPNLTPPDDPEFAQLTGELLASKWGTGIAQPRYTRWREGPAHERHLILCNLAVRSSSFGTDISFPFEFGGEENIMMGDAEAKKHRLWYSPNVWVYHRRRRTFPGYLEQVYRYGWGRANAIHRAPNTAHPFYFIPVAFGGYLLALPVLAAVSPLAWIPLGAYGVFTGVAAAKICIESGRPGWFPALVALFPVTHLAYAAGLSGQLARLSWHRLIEPAQEMRRRAQRG